VQERERTCFGGNGLQRNGAEESNHSTGLNQQKEAFSFRKQGGEYGERKGGKWSQRGELLGFPGARDAGDQSGEDGGTQPLGV